jgi:phage gp45-like
VVEPDRAVIAFTTSDGPTLLRLTRQDGKTIADLSRRKRAVATSGLLPKPGQVKLMLGNKTDDAAVVTIDERTIRLAARAGEQLAYSDDTADELPDSQKIDLPPGKYKVTIRVDGSTAQNRAFEVAANETWGLLVGPDGAPLPMRLY